MTGSFVATRRRAAAMLSDSLHRNSLLLIANSLLQGALGFAFWAVATRMYGSGDVGIVLAFVGACSLASAAATMGLPNTVMRFRNYEADTGGFVGMAFVVVAVAATVLTLLWYVIPGHAGLRFPHGTDDAGALVVVWVAVLMSSLSTIGDTFMIAQRATGQLLAKNGIGCALRLGALPVLVVFHGTGLLVAVTFGSTVTTLLTVAVVARELGGVARLLPTRSGIRSMRSKTSFALWNHLATLVALLPSTTTPAIAVVLLGEHGAAYVAIPLLLVTMLNLIPGMTAQAMFAEAGVEGASLSHLVGRAIRATYVLLAPAATIVFAFAPLILSVFGSQYAAHSTAALRFMTTGALIAGFNYVADVGIVAAGRVRSYVMVNVVGTVLVVVAVTAGMSFGVTGVGVGWLMGQVGYAVVAAVGLRGRPLHRPRAGTLSRARPTHTDGDGERHQPSVATGPSPVNETEDGLVAFHGVGRR